MYPVTQKVTNKLRYHSIKEGTLVVERWKYNLLNI